MRSAAPLVAASASEAGRRPVFAGDARHGAARTVRIVRAARSVVCGAIGFRPQRPKSGPLAVRGEVRLRALGGERALCRRRVAATGVPNVRHAIAAVGHARRFDEMRLQYDDRASTYLRAPWT